MTSSTIKIGGAAIALLLGGAAVAVAQQAYDPMRAAREAPAPALESDAAPGDTAVALNPEFDDLPDTAGVEETYYQCVACHSTAIIKQQKISDARWDYLWDWMVKDQGMVEPDEETKEIVLDYLKEHFSSER